MACNHRICDFTIGHDMEPKIFWVRSGGQGPHETQEPVVAGKDLESSGKSSSFHAQALNLMGVWCSGEAADTIH
jgi:hypothetical protein